MNRYIKISAALAAFALLLVVMGLSTQPTVNAQVGSISLNPKWVCSDCGEPNNQVEITVTQGDNGEVTVTNLDVAEVTGVNPKTFQLSGETYTISVVQEGTGVDAQNDPDGSLAVDEVRGFNGNRLEVEFEGSGGAFSTFAEILVDNVDPSLVESSPDVPLVVKGSTNVVFAADITDNGAGYTGNVNHAAGIEDLNGTPGAVPNLSDGGSTGPPVIEGGIQLVVAGNIVRLDAGDFEKIDGGWRVSKEINSSSIQGIGANTPWYWVTTDRAGNTKRSTGSIELKPVGADAATDGVGDQGTTLRDPRFIGNLQNESIDGSQIEVKRDSDSIKLDVISFAALTGTFTFEAAPDDHAVFGATDPAEAPNDEDDFFLLGTNQITVDSKNLRLKASKSVYTGVAYDAANKKDLRNTRGRANSIKIELADDGKTDDPADNAGSGLDASSVSPAAFVVSGNSVSSTTVNGNDIYLTLSDNLGPDEQPSVEILGGHLRDKAGNAWGGTRVGKATDNLGPNLGLVKDADLSDEEVVVTISTDEALSKAPAITLSRVVDKDGNFVTHNALVCEENNEDPDDPQVLLLDASLKDADGMALASGADCGDLTADTTDAETARVGTVIPDPRRPFGSQGTASQREALAYRYTVEAADVLDGNKGGKFNVYALGTDTQAGADGQGNSNDVGDINSANDVGAFTFQLDTTLNGGVPPVVKVGEAVASADDSEIPDVEAIDNLIVTVEFKGESGEYPGDSYRTVDLTLAELTISFKDGTKEKTTFNLTTDVNSPDNIQFTVALLNPKVGNYSLKVKATDSAGNASDNAGHVSKWGVVSAKPVPIALAPGWNMISLPFQPGNPAINSVIKSTHPADIVMTFDGPTQTWLVSRRDAESGLFVGDIAVMTASTAYFVRTTNFQALSILRPPIATNAAPPPQIPALAVVRGWNLIPIVSNASPLPDEIPADEYFGTLSNSGNAGWLKAITFNTLARTWEDVTPGETVDHDNDADTPAVPATVKRGKGYWLYATGDGVIIP